LPGVLAVQDRPICVGGDRQSACYVYIHRLMAKKSPTPSTLTFGTPRPRRSLIDWTDPSRQAHVLDWHQRAEEFGLAVDGHEAAGCVKRFTGGLKTLVQDYDPDAFSSHPIPHDEDEAASDEESDTESAEAFEPGPRDEIDLVRVYLQHIG